jgi:hypothetical protein
MKNVVFMMDIDLGGEGRYSSTRRLPYKYSISSWKQWCKANNVELFILDELLLPQEQMAICWQRCSSLLEAQTAACRVFTRKRGTAWLGRKSLRQSVSGP